MKLHEIANPNEEQKEEQSAFLRPQAGPLLTKRDRKQIARKLKSGHVPMFLKKQAE